MLNVHLKVQSARSAGVLMNLSSRPITVHLWEGRSRLEFGVQIYISPRLFRPNNGIQAVKVSDTLLYGIAMGPGLRAQLVRAWNAACLMPSCNASTQQ